MSDGRGSRLLEANLAALSRRHPALAAAVRAAGPAAELGFSTSRDGRMVPVAERPAGPLALHSLVDPVREADRLLSAGPRPGFAVFLGLGAGFAVARALRDPDLFAAVVVERDAQTLRALLAHVDLEAVLRDTRVSLLAGGPPQAVAAAVLSGWAPALMGDLRVLELRPWVEANRGWFGPVADGLRAAAGRIAADLAVQATFGTRWHGNALANLPAVERASLEIPPIRSAIVTGAGPSLDLELAAVVRERGGALLVATDTSLPALLGRGIAPDLVLSIDCQLWGYLHLMAGLPSNVPLLLDICSPPLLARRAGTVGFYASGHPLVRLFSRRFRRLPAIDASGGNVSHAAVSLCGALGARTIRLHGVDLSFPFGSTYARGTYQHPWLRSREHRLAPAEGSFYAMMVGTPGTEREQGPEGPRYVTPLMRDYRARLVELASQLDAEVLARFALPRRSAGGPAIGAWADGFRMGARSGAWREFLADYRDLLAGLGSPAGPLPRWFAALASEEREAWQTLLPLLPCLARRERRSPPADRPEPPLALATTSLLERARAWAIERASAVLDGPCPAVEHGRVAHE